MASIYEINDEALIDSIKGFATLVEAEERKIWSADTPSNFKHPLDKEVFDGKSPLNQLTLKDKAIDYTASEIMDELWHQLLKKAIICLRYFDKREPFMEDEDLEVDVYGMEDLVEYHHRYTDFESLLYGANTHYRDHVFHAIRVWLLGVFCMIKKLPKSGVSAGHLPYIEEITLDGGAVFPGELNFFEKISMWTIIALCHDLGYPLEKADQILGKTKNMMKDFVPNPNIWSDFSYRGVQDKINDYILRYLSTKMVEKTPASGGVSADYVGRIQPKYYMKFAKSLEHLQHGIIGSVIIYKLLVYFVESDFSLNEDYVFEEEEARQFYIRREILRAIAAHTCPDAYNVHINTFSSLLFLCDEMQEWGRKSWRELYTGVKESRVELNLEYLECDGIKFKEKVEFIEDRNAKRKAEIDYIVRIFARQYTLYKDTFRSGPSSAVRDFALEKIMEINLVTIGGVKREIKVEYALPVKGKSYFKVSMPTSVSADENDLLVPIKERIKDMPYSADVEVVMP